MMNVTPIAAFDDNYIWIIHNGRHNSSDPQDIIVVDPGDAEPVIRAIEANGWQLRAILLTHHHYDHTGGVEELLQLSDVPVYGPAHEKIKGVTHPLGEGDRIDFDDINIHLQVLDTPGHTRGHICYYGHDLLFCGDTLFAAGCGRIFEGTPSQMYASLEKIRALPKETQIYCAHEYTLQNLGFAHIAEPDNRE
ncbi:MAG: hydroxyacylglutathione hydrolase, partial [Gammaproteobacteria bacterium]|nr:hydroxyacylglutathione hydrolase [Gammaproteobacteria bacterium]